ncbi:DUF6415 family natural product biosynthesis protein [Streptomyces sp. NPDC007903]|uniref:DUF6415 family natural product biosynthesis protein n=1 Tax=Streptomyces sp. NPDC007903 TaxID=3364786 RepID=UPI0036E049AC
MSATDAPSRPVTDQLDTALMRWAAAQLLPEESATPPTGEGLEVLALLLRGQIQAAIPEIEHLSSRVSEDPVTYGAWLQVQVARRRLAATAGPYEVGLLWLARRLARSVIELADSHDRLMEVLS